MQSRSDVTLLSTPRCLLRPFTETDDDNLFVLYGNPAVMAIRKIGTQTRAGSDQQLGFILDHWRRLGFGLWLVLDRANGAFMGECGLREIRPNSREIELSYGLCPEYWGKGIASEVARTALDYGFGPLGIETIYGLAKDTNHASLRILEKLGFERASEEIDGEGAVIRCVLTRASWHSMGRPDG